MISRFCSRECSAAGVSASVSIVCLAVLLLGACEEGTLPGPLADCAKAEGRPFATAKIKRALGENGFSVFPNRDCAGAADIHVILANSDFVSGPPEGEGLLACAVRTHALWGDAIERDGPPILGRDKVAVTFANIDCQLYLDDVDGAEETARIERLLNAMRNLKESG